MENNTQGKIKAIKLDKDKLFGAIQFFGGTDAKVAEIEEAKKAKKATAAS